MGVELECHILDTEHCLASEHLLISGGRRVADSCWTREGYRRRQPPHRLAWLLVDDWRAMLATLDGLHELARARPEIDIIPTHCPEAFRQHVVQA